MRLWLGCVVVALMLAGTAYGQGDVFNGSWSQSREKSKNAAPPQKDILTYENSGDMEHYIGDEVTAKGVVSQTEYTAKYNDGKWYPVMDRLTHKDTGSVMIFRVEPNIRIRVSKSKSGTVSLLFREMEPDGKSYRSTTPSRDGSPTNVLVFDKQ